MFTHCAKSATIAAALALAVSATAQATDLFWAGGTGDLSDPTKYSPSATPGSTDFLWIGDGGTATATASLTVAKLFVGHNNTTGGLAGAGTVTLSSGAFVTNSTSTPTAYSTIVGYQNSGTLTLGGTSTLDSKGLDVGFGDDTTKLAILNLSDTSQLTISGKKNLVIGETPSLTGGVGIPGQVNVSGGTHNVSSILQVGSAAAGSSYSQTGGSMTTSGGTVVGPNGTDNTSFSFSGGSFTSSATFNLANSTTSPSDHTSASFSGGNASVVGMNLGASTSSNTSASFSGNVVFTDSGNLTLAVDTAASPAPADSGSATNTSMTVAGNASITVSGANGFFIGRGKSANTSLTMTGGSITVTNNFLMGTGSSATDIVVNHSAGTLTTTTAVNTTTGKIYNFAVGDTTTGNSTYNLSNTGIINTVAAGVIGRQHGTATMNQTGGTANFNGSLHIGDQQPSATITITPTLNATGAYNLSGGTLAINVQSGSATEALSIAPSGNGTFRVIGGDATMTVTGNMGVYANTSGNNTGTLVFQPEPNESLTTVTVSGTATFNPGSTLQLDLSATKPTRGLFTVLNAASIVNNGTLSLPGGWNSSITSGSNGQLLKLFAGDFNADGRIDGDDFAWIDRGAAQHLTTGADGDLNADGTINSQDYLLIDSAYAQLGNPLSPAFLADRERAFGPAYVSSLLAAVPEPTSLVACGFAIPALLRRRRR